MNHDSLPWRLGVLAALPLWALAPLAHAEGPDAAFEHAPPKRDGDLVSLSLENVDLAELVRAMSEMTGKRFVVSASPKAFQATVVAPHKVTVAEAYQAFLSILAANHLTAVPKGRFLAIVDAQDAARQAPVHGPKEGAPAEERFVTYLHRVSHVPAEEVAQGVLSKLASHDGSVVTYGNVLVLTDTGTNVRRMMRVLDEIDVAQAEDRVWIEPLDNVAAAEAKKTIDEFVDSKGSAGDKPAKASAPSVAGDARVTRVVALDHPNALLVVGTQAGYERVLEIVKIIDVPRPDEGQMHVVMLEHADAKKIVGPLMEAVSAASAPPPGPGGAAKGAGVLDAPVKISAEETNNALIVTASAHDFAAVREVIRRLDRPRRQVYIEAVVMDLSISRTTEIDAALHAFGDVSGTLGTDSSAYGGSNPLKSILMPTDPSALQALVFGVRGPSIPVPASMQGALGTTSIPGIGFFLDAYALSNDADILSTPNITATDNIPAEIHVQLNTSLQRNASSYNFPGTGATGAAAAASAYTPFTAPPSQTYGKIGPKIKVTPHLNESDEVRLDVEETISDLSGKPQGTLGTVDFLERGATTTLTVRDGRTVVIGGLVRDKVTHLATKVPLLGDIPVLGALFRSSADTVEKSNLVLVLTPHILRNEDDMRRIVEERMHERQEFLDHFFVFRDDAPPVGFDPVRGHGLLAELRASQGEAATARDLEAHTAAPATAHDPHAPLELPPPASAPAPTDAQPSPAPASLHVTPPARSVERVEK